MDKVTLIRSVHHDNSDHQHGMHWCQTGHDAKANGVNPFAKSSHPSSGSLVAMLRGSNHPGLPPYVLIGYPLDDQGIHRHYPHRAAYLGVNYNPLEILKSRTGDGKDPGQDADFRVKSLAPIGELTRKDFLDRRTLLDALRQCRPQFGQKRAGLWDHQYLAASDLLMGENTGAAFDLEKEDPKTRDHYGRNRSGQTALLARRLVEAGVTFRHSDRPRSGTEQFRLGLAQETSMGHENCQPAHGSGRDCADPGSSCTWLGQKGARRGMGRVWAHPNYQ